MKTEQQQKKPREAWEPFLQLKYFLLDKTEKQLTVTSPQKKNKKNKKIVIRNEQKVRNREKKS